MDNSFTLRINKILYEELKKQSDFLGIPIAAIIKFQLYLLQNTKIDIVDIQNVDSVRMSIKMPEHFFANVSQTAKDYDISMNQYINSIISHFLHQ